MKVKKQTNKYSGPDLNDKFMKLLGFFRDPIHDFKEFNNCGTITYWNNANDCLVATQKKVKLTPPQVIDLITRRIEWQTKEKIRRSI